MPIKIVPKKSLGQNFLINPRILDKIVAAAEITKEDIVLEVGPGTGNLTKKLAEKVLGQGSGQAGRVIAVEKDRRLIEFLKSKLSENSAIAGKSEIIEGDILKLKIKKLKLGNFGYKIVANIPYYITSRFLRKVFAEWPKPKLIILTVQKEVAQRIVAKPPHMNLLAVSIQFFAEPQIVSYISKNNFRPRPKVDSAIIKLRPKEKLPTDDPEKFFKIAKAGFSGKRKQLINSLSHKLELSKNEALKILNKAGLNPESRPEELNIQNWLDITKYFIIIACLPALLLF